MPTSLSHTYSLSLSLSLSLCVCVCVRCTGGGGCGARICFLTTLCSHTTALDCAREATPATPTEIESVLLLACVLLLKYVFFYYTALDCAREAAAAELMMMARGAGASPGVGAGGGAEKGAGGGEQHMAQMASVYRRSSLLLCALLLDCEASPKVGGTMVRQLPHADQRL